MKSCSRWAATFVVLAASMLAGCTVKDQTQPWPKAQKTPDPGVSTIPVSTGFYKGRIVEFWNAGPAPSSVSHVYVLYRKGSHNAIPFDQQYPIIDALTGDAGYSPFRHVIKVTVPTAYVANTMTSVEDLANALYLNQALLTYTAWDAPSVDENATLGGSSATPMPVWYKGKISYVFRLEGGDQDPNLNLILINRNTEQVPVSDILEISRGGVIIPGQSIFTTARGDAGYSPLRQEMVVNVSESYPTSGSVPWQSVTAVDGNFGGYLIEKTESPNVGNKPIKSVGAYALQDEDLGHVDDSGYISGVIPERECWNNGVAHHYFDLGLTTGLASDMWVLYRTGQSTPIEGQDAIATSVPGDGNYGEARRIHRIYLDSNAPYTPNSIKTYQTLLQLEATDEVHETWNAPVVKSDARAGDQTPRSGWVNGRRFEYLVFETNVIISEDGLGVTFMPSFQIFRQRDDADPDGQWLDFNDLIRNVPGEDSYSPFMDTSRIVVYPTYPDTTWKSYTDAISPTASQYIYDRPAGSLIYNRPVH